jgi:fucose 4-O-acetylase-like acetyltransferase
MTPSDRRNIRIDSLRGLACLLLVLYHVVGSNTGSGLRFDRSHGLVLFNEVLSYLRMPLFSVLSGYVYSRRPFRADAGAFIAGKARRLLIPMLVVGTAFALLQAAVPGSNSQVTDWRMLHIVPVAHYWFLESLFLIFMAILALEYINALATATRFAAVLVAASALFVIDPLPVFFGLSGAVYLFPFVLFGLWCGRFAAHAKADQQTQLKLAWLSLSVAILHAVMVGQALPNNHSLTALVIGIAGCLVLLRSRIEWTWLARVGRYSFAIFLFHAVTSAASRIGLTKLGLTSIYVTVPVGLLAGIALPMLAALWLKNVPWWTQWVLGESAPQRARASSGRAVTATVLPLLAQQRRRAQKRWYELRGRLVPVEFVPSVQSKQPNETAF